MKTGQKLWLLILRWNLHKSLWIYHLNGIVNKESHRRQWNSWTMNSTCLGAFSRLRFTSEAPQHQEKLITQSSLPQATAFPIWLFMIWSSRPNPSQTILETKSERQSKTWKTLKLPPMKRTARRRILTLTEPKSTCAFLKKSCRLS